MTTNVVNDDTIPLEMGERESEELPQSHSSARFKKSENKSQALCAPFFINSESECFCVSPSFHLICSEQTKILKQKN
jgi:hypothetical protein